MPDIITMPAALYKIAASRFNLVSINQVSPASAFNPLARISGAGGIELWQVDVTFTTMKDDDLDELRRFVMKLRGGKVLARIYDKSKAAAGALTQPRGAGGSGPTVNANAGAAAGAESLTLRGLIASQAVSLRAMDMLGVGENLHVAIDTAPSDSGGLATASIRPPLRMGVADGDAVNLVTPTGLFRLLSGDDQLTLLPGNRSDQLTLSFIEEPMFA